VIHYLEQNKLPLTTSLYISQTEEDMHRDLRLCYQNWTSHQTFIKQTMIECETGKDRLAQPLEATDAIIGHKTGTGDLNARWQLIGTNDIGFVFLPDEERYTIAVFAKDSEESPEATAAIIADISRIVYQYIQRD